MGRKLIISLITNRFGIVLAAINVSYLANHFSSGYGMKHSVPEVVFMCANIPALIAAFASSNLVGQFIRLDRQAEQDVIAMIFVSICLVAQWLFIANLARLGANYVKTK